MVGYGLYAGEGAGYSCAKIAFTRIPDPENFLLSLAATVAGLGGFAVMDKTITTLCFPPTKTASSGMRISCSSTAIRQLYLAAMARVARSRGKAANGHDALHSARDDYGTILIDPPWQFQNRTGKVAPEHRRLSRYSTMGIEEIKALNLGQYTASKSHLYLWCPNALLPEGLDVMKAWGFEYKTNIVWYKTRKDGGPDGRGVGFYFRNVTELLLFGIKGKIRTLDPGRSQVNVIVERKREHSRKPDSVYEIIESCSPADYLEIFARQRREGWDALGDEVDTYVAPDYPSYSRRAG